MEDKGPMRCCWVTQLDLRSWMVSTWRTATSKCSTTLRSGRWRPFWWEHLFGRFISNFFIYFKLFFNIYVVLVMCFLLFADALVRYILFGRSGSKVRRFWLLRRERLVLTRLLCKVGTVWQQFAHWFIFFFGFSWFWRVLKTDHQKHLQVFESMREIQMVTPQAPSATEAQATPQPKWSFQRHGPWGLAMSKGFHNSSRSQENMMQLWQISDVSLAGQ